MSIHNICFRGEIRKTCQYLLAEKLTLSGAMLLENAFCKHLVCNYIDIDWGLIGVNML